MRGKVAILAAVAAAAVALTLVLLLGDVKGTRRWQTQIAAVPGVPSIEVISPRNGERQSSHAVVVTAQVHNFLLAPRQFGGEPLLSEGFIRFSLSRIPDCVTPKELKRAINNPTGNGRVGGVSFDYPRYSGPNGVLAERIGSAGSYSPATRPTIFYHNLPPGFYRLIVDLAQNNGAMTPFHTVAHFQVLPNPGRQPQPCRHGTVPSLAAAANLQE